MCSQAPLRPSSHMYIVLQFLRNRCRHFDITYPLPWLFPNNKYLYIQFHVRQRVCPVCCCCCCRCDSNPPGPTVFRAMGFIITIIHNTSSLLYYTIRTDRTNRCSFSIIIAFSARVSFRSTLTTTRLELAVVLLVLCCVCHSRSYSLSCVCSSSHKVVVLANDRPTQRTNERWQNLIHHLSSTILRVCAAAAPHRRCRPPLHIIKTVPSVSSSRRLRRPSACLPLPPRTTTTFC